MEKIPVLQYLQKMIAGEDITRYNTHQRYPTAIANTLQLQLVSVGAGIAEIGIDANVAIHGNQQGTIHGGLLCELADAAIGTAHSTLMQEGESFTSLELKINFFRPVWQDRLIARAQPVQSGRTITVYNCYITNSTGKTIAMVTSTVMTLRGDSASGR